MKATPTKLRSGNWGARVTFTGTPPSQGTTVTITTRSGKSWEAVIDRVIWTGDGVAICATSSLDRPARRSHRRRSRECECGWGDDLMSFGYSPGWRGRCPECGGWAEAC